MEKLRQKIPTSIHSRQDDSYEGSLNHDGYLQWKLSRRPVGPGGPLMAFRKSFKEDAMDHSNLGSGDWNSMLCYNLQIDRQIDRQTDRQIYRQIDRQKDRQIDRRIDIQIDRQIDRQIDKQIRLDQIRLDLDQIRLD